jgi:hypothetical protein
VFHSLASYRAAGLAAITLLAAGCQAKPPDPTPSPEEIRALMRGNVVEVKPPPLRLGVLGPADVPPRFREKPLCRLRQGEALLLVARGDAALARIDGKVTMLARGGRVDATGAFYRGPGITVSLGSRDPHPIGAAPVGVTLGGGPPDAVPQKLDATWGCSD